MGFVIKLYNKSTNEFFEISQEIVDKEIFSEEGSVGYFQKWMKIQQESLQDIYESFRPIPVFNVQLMRSEIRKYEPLFEMGNYIYKEASASEVLFKDKIFKIEKLDEGCYNFIIKMPFVDKKELNLYQKGDELSISIKNEKRSFMLPKSLHSKEIDKASYEDGKLIIRFRNILK